MHVCRNEEKTMLKNNTCINIHKLSKYFVYCVTCSVNHKRVGTSGLARDMKMYKPRTHSLCLPMGASRSLPPLATYNTVEVRMNILIKYFFRESSCWFSTHETELNKNSSQSHHLMAT